MHNLDNKKFKYLHSYWEIILGFRWEEYIHSFLDEWLVSWRRSSYFNDMQLEEKFQLITGH